MSKKSRFSAEEMNNILMEPRRTGDSVTDVCRRHNISAHTFYQWKKKVIGLGNDENKRIKELEAYARQLERALIRQTLDNGHNGDIDL